MNLVFGASCVITDSGGIQKEAYYLKTPCVTLREETEWTETIDVGWNSLVEIQSGKIVEAVKRSNYVRTLNHPDLYGKGDTAKRIKSILLKSTNEKKTCAA